MNNIFLNNQTKIAVIGFGRFGQLLVNILLEYSHAKFLLVTKKEKTISHKNVEVVAMDKINDADLIIPCVPISEFESVIKNISPHIKNGAIVMDICSVKVLPVKIMKRYLPSGTQIIASHPMFGPDSYAIKKQLKGLRLMLWNITASHTIYKQVKNFFNDLGLILIEITPEEHDKLLAMSLGYSYLIGKISQRMKIKNTVIDTYDFHLLLDHVSIIKKDSEQLFFDMQTKNPFAKHIRSKLKKIVNKLLLELNN